MSVIKNEDARFFWFTIGFSFIVFGTGSILVRSSGRPVERAANGERPNEPLKGFYLLRVFKDRNNQKKRADQWAAITQDIENARAILARAKRETLNQNSFRGSRRASTCNGSIRKLSFATGQEKPRSTGTF